MTTATQAYAVIRSTLETLAPKDWDNNLIALRWHRDVNDPLPDVPAPFAWTMFDADRSSVIEIGSGRGHNRHRTTGVADIYVFVPKDRSVAAATAIADTIATRFRLLHASGVNVQSASVHDGGPGSDLKPPGMDSEVGNYVWSLVSVEFFYDEIG